MEKNELLALVTSNILSGLLRLGLSGDKTTECVQYSVKVAKQLIKEIKLG